MRLGIILMLVLLLVGASPLHSQDEPDTRPFDMGFTPFPYEISLSAVIDVYEKIAADADLIVHHFDNGVPWLEALAGSDYSDNIQNDWRLRKTMTPREHRVLVTVTPISITRDALAPYRGEQDDMPLPAPWDSYTFDHPDVIQAFINYCEHTIAFFEPDYFLMGIEVNLLMKLNPNLWDAYMTLHREVYAALKANHPDLPVMVSMTGIDLIEGYTDADHEAQVRALEDVIDYTDLLALSIYPYMTAYMTNRIPTQLFDELAALTEKPLAVSETGYPAQSFHVAMGADLQFNGTPGLQAEWVSLLLEKADEHNFAFVVNFVLRDYDALWRELGAREDLTIVWRDTGLYDEDGNERPALAIWREWLQRDVER